MAGGLFSMTTLMVLSALLLSGMLLTLAWIDIKTGLLPDVLTLSLLWAGLLVNLNGLLASLSDAVLGAAVGYLFLWAANQLHRRLVGHDGLGYGDFKLTAALGAWFGITLLPWIVIGACATGWGAATAHRSLGGGRHAPLPFGPCLAAGGITALAFVFSR